MPLRDRFHPPLDELRRWEGFHATWPVMIVAQLKLPQGYFAEPRVHCGAGSEIDVATFEDGRETGFAAAAAGGVATAVWAPPRPTFAAVTDLPSQDEYEVRVYDDKRRSHLVAAIEIVSPANKDRPEHRRAFVSRCADLLRQHVSVVIVDIVTTRLQNLYADLLDVVGQTDPSLQPEPPSLYVCACRMKRQENEWLLESWLRLLALNQGLPTVPLWLADDLAVPLELNESYENSCRLLKLPLETSTAATP